MLSHNERERLLKALDSGYVASGSYKARAITAVEFIVSDALKNAATLIETPGHQSCLRINCSTCAGNYNGIRIRELAKEYESGDSYVG